MCVVLYFINDFGSLFKLDFFFKYDGYFVNGLEFKFRFIVDYFKLYSYVKFSVCDLVGESSFVLNGKFIFLE